MKPGWLPLIVLAAFGLGFFVSAFLRVGSTSEPIAAPARPTNVPSEAVWAGGVDGGVWVKCEPSVTMNFHCEIFADQTGASIESGEFSLKPARTNEAPGYSFYSSGMIRLDSAVLERREGSALSE